MSANRENQTNPAGHTAPAADQNETIIRKLIDAETPGYWSEFTDEEAEFAGAFDEDAISEEDAYKASFDNPDTW